ncbi:NAD kinase [Corynebacterium lipophiloflavum]|uniref:NAD kinase n=1 Tax=Corynebacterium lipophiloflavum (strain ATCC 700352 / DSM 44291 / CCUG 37336 / JCM 10383 / DMMZ 1944) TaxID=525263 RepID=C0XT76_CORLD|nr:NAD kinase [Corynebacterium lipophiloflavum]EEI16615.1 NAD(+)/NADH kinase [Corynebacterium lipophiloflavum DSM 44291]
MTGIIERTILLVPHTYRAGNISAAARAAELLSQAGIEVRLLDQGRMGPVDEEPALQELDRAEDGPEAAAGCELVLVLGGDGTFLRAANYAHEQDVPVLGINLGHVGFLAEWEQESLDEAIGRVIDRTYRIEDRMTIDVVVTGADNNEIGKGWALNEASIENVNRTRVMDAILEVDYRPVSSFGCDGVLISTPTGSTAYAFAAGGPVLWPEVEALLVVPNNAHALFTKPLVVSPRSMVAVESEARTGEANVVLDGFRTIEMPPGSRVEAVRGRRPVRWVRLDEHPFTDRLVHKFQLPVSGWRGPLKK